MPSEASWPPKSAFGRRRLAEEGCHNAVCLPAAERSVRGPVLCRHDLGPEATARRAQCRTIAAHVQIRAVETGDLRRVFSRRKGRDLRALSEVRLRPRLRQQETLVSVDFTGL